MRTQDKETQATMTPKSALEMLQAGNRRFLENSRAERNLPQQVQDTRDGQWPFAAILGCIDSRAPAELIFDQGVGDVFNIRIAGNFVNEDILGSMEFACKVAGARLILVVGHTHCGAIKGACDGVQMGNLTKLLEKLDPAVCGVESPAEEDQRTSGNPDFVQQVAELNVSQTIQQIRERSEVLRDLEADSAIGIVGAMYDVQSGSVLFQPSESPALRA